MQIGLVPITAFRHPPGVSEHTPHKEGGIPYRNEKILNSTQQYEIPKTKNQKRIWREQGKQRKKEKVTHNQPRIIFLISNNKCEKMNSEEICIPPPEFYKLSLKAKGRINPSRQVRTQVFIPTQPSWSMTLRWGTKTGRSQPRKRNWDPGNRRAGRASPRKAAAQQLSRPNPEPTDGGVQERDHQ